MGYNFTLIMIPLTVILTILPIIGIIGNSIMVIATFKAKRFNSPCHVLIALTCTADLINELGQFPFVVNFFTNTTISRTDCFWILSLSLFAAAIASPLILTLGIDRFIAIKCPFRNSFGLQGADRLLLQNLSKFLDASNFSLVELQYRFHYL
ncbi:hypothetical protein DICVIV_04917 [Dictyocaulus viviparus]|uniref:G-protein coupled receptors family 1 profile domain-containing protein n=1 Tax=Dictyocaulus viviparus TaxID=29172 RepID=A0A0D8XYM3_DICVI|nr:hypothetical protein DICVIV_04917 [Dictyocaulus viviparus]